MLVCVVESLRVLGDEQDSTLAFGAHAHEDLVGSFASLGWGIIAVALVAAAVPPSARRRRSRRHRSVSHPRRTVDLPTATRPPGVGVWCVCGGAPPPK